MVSPHRIRYSGIFSNELNIPDLITCVAFDSDSGEVNTFLSREAVASESYDGRYKRIHNMKYTETFSPKFTFTKSNFGDFSQEEVRATLKWLTQKDTTALLEVYYDDSNVVSWASIGGFVELSLQKLANNRTVAIIATWDSISPFAMSDLYTTTKTITEADNKITINIDTDDNKPVYPRVTIQEKGSVVRIPSGTAYNALSDMVENTAYFNGTTYYWKSAEKTNSTTKPNYNWEVVEVDGDYTDKDTIEKNKIYHYKKSGKYYWIDPYYFHSSTTNPNLSTTSVRFRNTHTDFFNQSKVLEPVVVKNNNTTEFITLDGANKIVSSNSAKRIFGNDFNLQHLELYDGKNEIIIEGNCEVTLSWREARKVGEY
jgi:hypothetical protein